MISRMERNIDRIAKQQTNRKKVIRRARALLARAERASTPARKAELREEARFWTAVASRMKAMK